MRSVHRAHTAPAPNSWWSSMCSRRKQSTLSSYSAPSQLHTRARIHTSTLVRIPKDKECRQYISNTSRPCRYSRGVTPQAQRERGRVCEREGRVGVDGTESSVREQKEEGAHTS
eukprot:Tamp_40578.p1 GENE.Tamp_40578~~Tamp_40578.p1  ORF type:complete len:114 (+),score=5.12 Tamp_40578:1-342(+)